MAKKLRIITFCLKDSHTWEHPEDELAPKIDKLLARNPKYDIIILDFTKVTGIDSRALGILASRWFEASELGIKMQFKNVDDFTKEIMHVIKCFPPIAFI